MTRGWPFGLAAGVLVALLYLAGLLEMPESRTVDLRFDLRGLRPPTFPIVLVTADDDSLAEMERQWPWPRSMHAELLNRIAAGNPVAIGVDILFAEPSRQAEDRRLAAAVAQAKVVVLGASLRTLTTQTGIGVAQHRELFEPPTPEIRAGAAGLGFVELDRGRDAVVRAGVLRRQHAGQLHESFTARLYQVAVRRLGIPPGRAAGLDRVWINFRGPAGTFPTYPYYQVYRGEVPPETFAGSIVLVGMAALSLHDRHPAPFSGANWLPGGSAAGGEDGQLMPGTEIQANLLDALLADDPIRRLPGAVSLVLILFVAVGAAWLAQRLRPLLAIGGTLGLGVGYLALAQAAFAWGDLWLEVVPMTLALALAAGGTIAFNYMREERVRREYARFFSPAIARQIAEDRSGAALAGKRRCITVLFSDIRDFTAISEGLRPEQVVDLLGEYFNTMVPIVLKHGGTLDKYVGDAIMALFGAPLPQEDHAARAVRAAQEMLAALPQLSPRWEALSGRPLRIGIGINTGEAVVGVMGADHRREYSAIGDTVNLASRLESATKELKTPLVVSQYTAHALAGAFPLRPLQELHVKGRAEAVATFAVEPTEREG